ncbi:MAG: recombinase family protein [Methylocystaceae bacterium]|nr:recombinase family protein [Methylocystaceae bacterium]
MTIWPHIDCGGRKIGYARVSTKDQKLGMQLDALNAVGCDKIFKDHGVSGAKGSRHGLDQMLETLKPNDSVIVFKLDRLGRSVLHLSDLLVKFKKEGIHFCSISEGINTTTPGGKLIYHMFSAFAEFQRDIIVENTVAGIEAARKRGKKIGRPYAIDAETANMAHARIMQDGIPSQTVAAQLDISHVTLLRNLERFGLNE